MADLTPEEKLPNTRDLLTDAAKAFELSGYCRHSLLSTLALAYSETLRSIARCSAGDATEEA